MHTLTIAEPMLAATLMPSDMEHTDENILAQMRLLKYPVLATKKLDGIRALKMTDLVSRRFKMIPNESIRQRAMKLPRGLDMELYAEGLSYDEIESIVMSEVHERSDEIKFHLLDVWSLPESWGYGSRVGKLLEFEVRKGWDDVVFPIVEHVWNAENLLRLFLDWETECEGICFRLPDSPYKQGRSTLKQQWLVKLSRFVRFEATIIGFKEQMHNANSSKHNAVGKMDRSKCGSGMVGKGTLGSLICTTKSGVLIDVGSGLTDRLRQEIWNDRIGWTHKQITIKSKPYGVKDKPRHPVYVGKREKGF